MERFTHIKYHSLTDVGKKRKNNEDYLGAFPDAGLFCVADGMGGGDDGEIASAAVVRAVEGVEKKCIPSDDGGYAAADVADLVEKALNKASGWIFDRCAGKKLTGCGSTYVGVVLDATQPGSALAMHAGDSRLYLLHGRSITQITRDHSAAEMIGAKDASRINPMFRSMVTNAVGIEKTVDVERTPFKIAAGDRILVCSDGLFRMVPDKKIAAISNEHANVKEAVVALMNAALDAGGVDNTTIILLDVGPLPEPVKAIPLSAEEENPADGGAETDQTGRSEANTAAFSSQTLKTMQSCSTIQTLNTLVPDKAAIRIGIGRIGVGEQRPPAPTPAPQERRSKRSWIAAAGGGAALIAAAAVLPAVLMKSGGSAPQASRQSDPPQNYAENRGGAVGRMSQVELAEQKPVAPVSVLTNTAASPNTVPSTAPQSPVAARKKAGEDRGAVSKQPPSQIAACKALEDACAERSRFVKNIERFYKEGEPSKKLVHDRTVPFKIAAEAYALNPKEEPREKVKKVLVDLRNLLKDAVEVRETLERERASSDNRKLGGFLDDWDRVVAYGADVPDSATQEAAARLIKDESGVLKR